MTTTSAPNRATPSPSRRILAISLAIIAALVVGFFIFASLYADWLWYDQLGFQEVLLTQWVARVIMFVVGFLGMAVPLWVTIQLAYRLRPVYVRLSSQLDRYQEVVEPLRRLAMWGIPVFFGFFAGFAASTQWQTTWLWLNGVTTDVTDPIFNLDTGFYMFAMPFYSALLGFVSAVLLVSLRCRPGRAARAAHLEVRPHSDRRDRGTLRLGAGREPVAGSLPADGAER